jgi:hypothetical protein
MLGGVSIRTHAGFLAEGLVWPRSEDCFCIWLIGGISIEMPGCAAIARRARHAHQPTRLGVAQNRSAVRGIANRFGEFFR